MNMCVDLNIFFFRTHILKTPLKPSNSTVRWARCACVRSYMHRKEVEKKNNKTRQAAGIRSIHTKIISIVHGAEAEVHTPPSRAANTQKSDERTQKEQRRDKTR